LQSLEYLAQQALVGHHSSRRRRHYLDQVLLEEVIEQDTDHAKLKVDDRADLRHADGDAAQVKDPAALRVERRGVSLLGAADDD
jgi:hypothetical protein